MRIKARGADDATLHVSDEYLASIFSPDLHLRVAGGGGDDTQAALHMRLRGDFVART